MGIAAQCVHGAKVCIIPNPDNEYRPLALRHRPLAAVSALLITAKILSLGLIALMPAPAELSTITTARIIQLTNQERTQAGLAELTVNEALSAAAVAKAQDILEHDYFAHISPAGVTPWFWINNAGYSYRLAGENLAIDFVEAEDAVAAWMASPSHRDNLLQPEYRETGVGVLTGEFEGTNSTVVVHMFGRPVGTPTPAPPGLVVEEISPPTVLAVDSEAPAAPQIKVEGGGVVQDKVAVLIKGEAGAEIILLLNSQERREANLDAGGVARATLSLTDLPDGDIVVRALALDAAGNRSDLSEPLIVQKDTTGPEIRSESLTFIVSPQTDEPRALLKIEIAGAADVRLTKGAQETSYTGERAPVVEITEEPILVTAYDKNGNSSRIGEVALQPSFYADADNSYFQSPAKLTGGVRKITLAVIITIAALLSLAVLIRIRIQRPGMIMHAVLVLVIAVTLLTI